MGKLGITTDVLNQKGSPALYQDLFGNIPAAGYTGRLFVSTDTNNLYRDNGSSWVQIAGSSGGSGVTSITGTANQVIASAATGAIVLSLPQNINSGASPTFAGITLSGLSSAGIVINNGSGVLSTTNGTGFVKISGGTISYDNSTYLTTAAASAAYQPLITLTTTGASGAATFTSNTLNVPAYTLAGLGGISLTALSASSPLSYNSGTGAFAIQVANTSQAGYLTASDWNTFNGKQAQINGTGFVKASGTTISYDNSTYLTTAAAASTYLPLSGGTLTNVNNVLTISTGGAGGAAYQTFVNNGGTYTIGGDNSGGSLSGSSYAFYIAAPSGKSIVLGSALSGTSASFSSTVLSKGGGNVITADILAGASTLKGFTIQRNDVEKFNIGLDGSDNLAFINSSGTSVASVTSTGQATFANNITALTAFFSTLSVAGYTYTSSQTITAGYLIVYGSGGSAGQTLTLPAASGTNQQLFFKNLSSNSVTISRAGSDNLIALGTSTTSTTYTLAAGGQCGFVADGASKWVQQY